MSATDIVRRYLAENPTITALEVHYRARRDGLSISLSTAHRLLRLLRPLPPRVPKGRTVEARRIVLPPDVYQAAIEARLPDDPDMVSTLRRVLAAHLATPRA